MADSVRPRASVLVRANALSTMNSNNLLRCPANPGRTAQTHFRFPGRGILRAGLTIAAGLVATIAHAQSNYATPYFFTTLAGATSSGAVDGIGNAARFNTPQGVAVDASGNVYLADTNNHTIRKITFFGVVTTLAGSAGNLGDRKSVV